VLSPLEVLLLVAHTFERFGIDYVVVGSFASSARGRARATADVDLVADLRAEHVPLLGVAFADALYLERGRPQSLRGASVQFSGHTRVLAADALRFPVDEDEIDSDKRWYRTDMEKFRLDEQWYRSDEDFFAVDGLDLTSDEDEFDQDIHSSLKDL
jgi:hypothetical protein